MTRWAPGVQINGGEFAESTLELGDRLTIGGVTLKLAPGSPRRTGSAPELPRTQRSPTPTITAVPTPPAPPRQRSVVPAAAPENAADASPAPAPQIPAKQTASWASSQCFTDALLLRTWTQQRRRTAWVRQLAVELGATRDNVEALTVKVGAAEARLADLSDERRRAAEAKTTLETALVAAKTQLAESHERHSADLAQLRLQLQQAAGAGDDANRARQDLAAAETLVAEKAAALAEAQASLAEREASVQQLTADLNTSRGELAAAQHEITRLASAVESLEARLVQSHDELRVAAAAQSDAAAALAADPQQSSVELATKLSSVERELEAAALEKSQLTHAIETLRADVASANAEAASLQQRLSDAQDELARSAAEAGTSSTVAMAEAEERLASDYAAQVAAAAEERDAARLAQEQLAREIDVLRSAVETAQQQIEAAHIEADAARADANAAKESLANLTRNAEAATRERDELERENQQAAQQVAEAEAERVRIAELLAQARHAAAESAAGAVAEELNAPIASDDHATHEVDDRDAESAIDRLRAAALWRDEAPQVAARQEIRAPEPEPSRPAEAQGTTSFYEQYRHLLDDDGSDAAPLPAKPEPRPVVGSRLADLASPSDDSAGDDDDAALQAYMENMMRRVRGEDDQPAAERPRAASIATPPAAPPPSSALHSSAVDDQSSASVESNPYSEILDGARGPLDLDTLRRSTSKPALPTDIDALRELANSSARGAIAKHRKDRLTEVVVGKLILAALALGAAAYLIVTAESLDSISFLAGAEIAVLGGWAMWRLFMNILAAAGDQVRPAHRKQAHEASDSERDDEQLAADDVEDGR